MWRNVLLSTVAGCGMGVLAGCTATEKPGTPATAVPLPERPASTVATAKPKTVSSTPAKPAPAPVRAQSRTPRQPGDRQEVPPLVKAETAWLDYGRTFLAEREKPGAGDGVPLFRQAIVLASVRAGLAGTPATPRAEFRNGLITLTFDRGTPQQIASAVNKTLDAPEVNRLRVILPP